MFVSLLTLVLSVVAQPGHAQAPSSVRTDTVHWTVLMPDSLVNRPIAGAKIRIPASHGTWRSIKTDMKGQVVVVVPRRGWAIIEAPGFRSARINLGWPDSVVRPVTAVFRMRRAFTGTVWDDRQHPVAGVEVDVDSSNAHDDHLVSRQVPLASAVSDAQGRVTLAPPVDFMPDGHTDDLLIVVASVEHSARVGVVAPTASLLSDSAPDLSITIAPPRTVHLPLTLASAGLTLERLEIEVLPSTPDGQLPEHWLPRVLMPIVAQHDDSAHWSATVLLPPYASYRVDVQAGPMKGSGQAFSVEPDQRSLDAPPLELKVTYWTQQGIMAPEIAAKALDGTVVHLADYRGKVIVLDFWAFWCEACILKMPEMIRLANKYRDSNVVFLALHDATIGSMADYQSQFATTIGATAHVTSLPFPVLMDLPEPADSGIAPPARDPASGRTFNIYGVNFFPTTLVIDRSGHLVGSSIRTEIKDSVDANGHIVPGYGTPEHDETLEALIHKAM